MPGSPSCFSRAWAQLGALTVRFPRSLALGGPLAALAVLLLAAGFFGPRALLQVEAEEAELGAVLRKTGLLAAAQGAAYPAYLGAWLCLCAGALAFWRRPLSLYLLRLAYIGVALVSFLYIREVAATWDVLAAHNVALDGIDPSEFRYCVGEAKLMFPALLVFAGALGLLLFSGRRRTLLAYRSGDDGAPTLADHLWRVLQSLLRNPFSRSLGASAGAHACIFLLPLLYLMFTRVAFYMIPYGRGLPDAGGGATESVQGAGGSARKPGAKSGAKKGTKQGEKAEKKQKLELKLTAKPGIGRITFVFPEQRGRGPALLRAEDVAKFEEETQDSYEAQTMTIIAGGRGSGTGGGFGPGNKPGGVGRGGVGPGGWPEGTRGAIVGFIRLQHRGEGWDDGMRPEQRADVNFLEFFQREIGFKVAKEGKNISVSTLRNCERGYAPPFVYLTGNGKVELSQGEKAALKAYLTDGGMLWADCGSPGFDRAVRNLITQMFPDKTLVNIPDDDPLFRFPFQFTNGAPPLWHHGGWRALGIRYQNRWIVFYHPGDMNDAWKTGHSGMDAEMAEKSLQLGVNIVYYAFCNYLDATRKYRK